MQTQQDLINLIGLKISDAKLIAHFDALGLKQPKSCTPNNSSSDINDKANAVQYWFHHEVKHEALYPPKMEGKPKKWATYLSSVSFVNESTILKKADEKPANFWNATPPPTADLAALKQYFGAPSNDKPDSDTIYFSKKINNLIEINCQFNRSKQRINAIWASVIESRELISYLYFRDVGPTGKDDYGTGMAEQNIMCLLIKWLHDNKHLNIGQNEQVEANLPAILSFARTTLKGKLWSDQLTNQDRLFCNFLSDGMRIEDGNGKKMTLRFKETALKALGKLDEYKAHEALYDRQDKAGEPTTPYWEPQENMVREIEVSPQNYALFAKAIEENLALYNKLMQLKVNRDAYYFD